MRVYHFTDQGAALSIIRGRRLRISRIKKLNDPFELIGFDLRDRAIREKMRRQLDEWDDHFGFVSFSENWTNPVQWAHYADRHQGLCLGFDIPDDHLMPITYASDRVAVSVMQAAVDRGDERTAIQCLFTKYEHWQYEQERRIVSTLENIDPDGHYYDNFGEAIQLREVIVGTRNKTVKSRMLLDILGDLNNVSCFKARPGFRKFRMERQLNRKLGLR